MTKRSLWVAVGQLAPRVGDIDGNVARAIAFINEKSASDLCVLSECFVTGYPFEDLAFRPGFLARAHEGLEEIAAAVVALGGPSLLIGCPIAGTDRPYNAAVMLHPDGSRQVATKVDLPNIGVFDEVRHFLPGALRGPFTVAGLRVGVMICEEMWHGQVARHLADELADVLVVLNGSPYERGKHAIRLEHARRRVADAGVPLIYVNQVGGQDELVFDGGSFALEAGGRLVAQLPFETGSFEVDVVRKEGDGREGGSVGLLSSRGNFAAYPDDMEADYRAIVMGLRDYVDRNGFPGVVLGMSGGIDSAFVAAVAVDALGPKRVQAITMPSRFNSQETLDDAISASRALGIAIDTIPIGTGVQAVGAMLAQRFAGLEPDVTEENIQARLRGMILMAVSNKQGPMVLATGNKSEMSVGYATLYGDMNGGYNPIKDVYKTRLFEMARWRNGTRPIDCLGPEGVVVPLSIIERPPSAELAEGQTDEARLGSYRVLDAVLEGIIELDKGPRAAALHATRKLGEEVAETYAEFVANLVRIAEYKRRQAPPGPKVSPKHFGRDRRYPISNSGKLW